jgi:hypothetical protein
MKILAIIDVVPGSDVTELRARLDEELRASWILFAGGKLREAYATSAPTRVVFVLEAANMAEADAELERMPLVAARLLRVELVELRPFTNWSLLFARA